MLDDFAVHAGGIEFSCCGPWIFGLWNIGKEVDLQRRLCATGRIRLFRFSAGLWRIWDPFEGKNCIAINPPTCDLDGPKGLNNSSRGRSPWLTAPPPFFRRQIRIKS